MFTFAGRRYILLAVLLFAACAIGVQSCIKGRCDNSVCLNGGFCVQGNCSCPSGYEGLNCEKIWNAKFLGGFHNTEIRVDSAQVADTSFYNISVRNNGIANMFLIDSLEHKGDSIICDITGPWSFKIRSQYSKDSSLYIVSGQGLLDSVSGNITLSYNFQLYHLRYSSLLSLSR